LVTAIRRQRIWLDKVRQVNTEEDYGRRAPGLAGPRAIIDSFFGTTKIVRSLSQHRLLQRVGTDEHLDTIASILDDMFRIPGTKIRFGLDAIVGWIPGIGDGAAGIASFLIVFAAWRRGTPGVTLTRMVANVVLETVVGAVPVIGDIFHVIWKANRRNYRLLMRERYQPRVNKHRDWLFLLFIVLTAITVFSLPFVILIWILKTHAPFY